METKKLTPMKRLAGSLDAFSAQLPRETRIVNLNKSMPREIPWVFARGDKTRTKGVCSDFIRIFQSPYFPNTVAFAFAYKDGHESVSATHKIVADGIDPVYVISEAMPVDEFREKLNSFNRLLVEQNSLKAIVNFNDFIDFFTLFFLCNPVDVNQSAKKLATELNALSATYRADLDVLKKNEETYTIALNVGRVKASSLVAALPESVEIARLQEQIKKLQGVIAVKKIDIEKDVGIQDIALNIAQAKNAIKERSEKFEDDKIGMIRGVPQAVVAKASQ